MLKKIKKELIDIEKRIGLKIKKFIYLVILYAHIAMHISAVDGQGDLHLGSTTC